MPSIVLATVLTDMGTVATEFASYIGVALGVAFGFIAVPKVISWVRRGAE